MHIRHVRVFISLLLLFPLQILSVARAQQDSTNITGLIEDTTGSVIVGAKVALHDLHGHLVAAVTADSEGRFALSRISSGDYELSVESMGFEPLRRQVAVAGSTVDLILTLHVAAVSQSIAVTAPGGYGAISAEAGTKVDIPLMETPISVAVVPTKVMADQQTVNLISAITNVSGVAPTNDLYGTGDSFSIRGFDAASLIYVDNIRLDEYSDSGFAQDMANVDSVEIVKGPASVLYGQGEPGGLVNIVTKRPLANRFGSLEQQYGNHSFYRTVVDINQPLLNKQVMARLIFDGLDAGSFRNFVHTNEGNFFPSLNWAPNGRLDILLQGSLERGSDYTDNGIPIVATPVNGTRIVATGAPANVPLSSNYVDKGSNWSPVRQFDIRPTVTLHLAENWPLRLMYKYSYITEPTPLEEISIGDVDSSGNLERIGFLTDYFHHRTSQVLAELPGKFSLGKIKNTFLVGFDFSKDFGAYDYNIVFPQNINIYAPVYNQPIGPADPAGQGFNTLGYIAYGGYIQDLAELPGNLFLLGGARMNWAETWEDYAGSYVGTTDVHERPTNPRAGLLWQSTPCVSFYGSYSSNYGDSALGSNAPGQKFLPPQSADQVEFGVKSEWLDKRLTASTAIYRIIKHNVPAPDPSNPALTIAIGTARTQGIEFDVAGQMTNSLQLIASFSNLQAVTTRDTDSLATDGVPSLQGLPFPSVPHAVGSLWATWEPQQSPLRGLRLGGGVNGHAGEQAYQTVYDVNFNPLGIESDQIQSVQLVSLMGGYERAWGKTHISAQLNIQNLTNRHYFSNVNPGQAMPGAPLNLLPKVQITF